MAGVGRATGGWLRQVRGLFGFGTVGGLSDGQLLDAFVSRRGDDSEAAFEELMHRHGPMVLAHLPQGAPRPAGRRGCVPGDVPGAGPSGRGDPAARLGRELALRRLATGRRPGPAPRARRRAGEQHVAEQTPEAYRPAEGREEPEALIEEIDRLPERLRTVVVLCYLEGMTYDAAAQRLGLSEGSIRGRLARARDQLRRRLTRRGVTLPAALLAAGTLAEGQARAAALISLPASARRLDDPRGDGLPGRRGRRDSGAGRAPFHGPGPSPIGRAGPPGRPGQRPDRLAGRSRRETIRRPEQPEPAGAAARPAASPDAERPADGPCAITGRVSVEGTGEPVPGARLEAFLGSYSGNPIIDASRDFSRTVRTGADGRYRVDLPAGYASILLFELPPGYYPADQKRRSSDLILSRDAPIARNDYTVRRGHAWRFDIRRDDGGPLVGCECYFFWRQPRGPRGVLRPIGPIRQGDRHHASGRPEAHRQCGGPPR